MDPQKRYVATLSKPSRDVLIGYTGSDYEEINDCLRKKKKLTASTKHKIDTIDSIFDGAPPLDSPITVYRGMVGKIESTLSTSYISTSLDRDKANTFTGNKCCMFEITVPAGAKVLPLAAISDVKSENEVLLHRKGVLIVTHEVRNLALDKDYFYSTYIPERYVGITPVVTLKAIKKTFSAEHWAERLYARINLDELDYFTPEEIVESVVKDSEEKSDIPNEAKTIVIARLKSTQTNV